LFAIILLETEPTVCATPITVKWGP
jgi:hypothetical protein